MVVTSSWIFSEGPFCSKQAAGNVCLQLLMEAYNLAGYDVLLGVSRSVANMWSRLSLSFVVPDIFFKDAVDQNGYVLELDAPEFKADGILLVEGSSNF